MSDPKIQEASAPAGAQEPLAVDSLKSTHGFDSANQNSLSFSRGPEVSASSAPVASRNGLSNGLGVSGREQENARPSDRRTLEGSTPGDFRAQAAPAHLPNNPGVREPMGQVPNGRIGR
jgi:hypothetical protein